MTARKPGLSRRQHVELGDQLQRLGEALTAILQPVVAAYPKSSKPVSYSLKVVGELANLRHLMDSVSAQELRGDDWSPLIYFGANADQRAAWLAANPLDDEAA